MYIYMYIYIYTYIYIYIYIFLFIYLFEILFIFLYFCELGAKRALLEVKWQVAAIMRKIGKQPRNLIL